MELNTGSNNSHGDYRIGTYEITAGHGGTPSALWLDGIQGDFNINSPANSPVGVP